MNRKRARHLWLELSRRIYLDYNGTLKGFGKVVFEWWIEGQKYSKAFSPYDGERIRDYTIINA